MADYLFAVGRIKALEGTLLDGNQWQRLSDAGVEDGMKLLDEFGYGSDASSQDQLEDLIATETENVRTLLQEIAPNDPSINLFLLLTDAHNIKVLFKSILMRTSNDVFLLSGGSIPIDSLKQCIETGDYDILPSAIRQAMQSAESMEDSRLLSATIDYGIYTHIFSALNRKKNPLLYDYFICKVDATNILTIIRGNILHWDSTKIKPLLLPCGEINERTLLDSIGDNNEQIVKQLSTGTNSSYIKGLLEKYLQNEDITDLEQGLENMSLRIIQEQRYDSFGIGPIINYMLKKTNEGRALRIMFAGKRAGIKIPLSQLGIG